MRGVFPRPVEADPYSGDEEPRVDEVWAIVPLSRPHMLPRVRENFTRQIFGGKKIVVVENGEGVGACKAAGFEPDLLLALDSASPASARNAALAALRDVPGAYFANMDDDDWYGAHYLSEHAGLAKKQQIVGKTTHWVHFEEKALCLFRPWAGNQYGSWANAGTLGGFAQEVPDYPEQMIGEENALCRRWLKIHHGHIWLSSIYHTAYVRRPDARTHTYAAHDRAFLRNMGNRCAAFEEGRWDLVSGESRIEGGELGEYTAENWPWKKTA